MKQHILLLAILALLPSLAQAEARAIAIEISYLKDTAKVTIHSNIDSERRTGISVAEAAAVIQKASGGHGFHSVMVLIVIHDRADVMSYLRLLAAIAKNPWFDLWAVRRPKDWQITRNILEHYKIKIPPPRHVPKPEPAK
jgi:hypothetical protein